MEKENSPLWLGLAVAGGILACACTVLAIVGVWWSAHRLDASQPVLRTPSAPEALGRIAYVGADGNVYTIYPDGGRRQAVTADRPADAEEYNMLAWSSQDQIAFAASRDNGSALFTAQPDGSQRTQLFAGGPDVAPFYLYWSPDGQHLAFLAPSATGTELRLAAGGEADSSHAIARGSPSYFSWAPDGQSVLMHLGGALRDSQDARMAIYDTGTSETNDLSEPPGAFQAPAWSPDGHRFLFVRQTESGGDELVLAEGEQRRVLAASRTGLVFNWSPRGDHVAFAIPGQQDSLLYSSVVVLDINGQERRTVAQGDIAAFFWSPDGQKLAVLDFDSTRDGPQGARDGRGASLAASAGPVPGRQQAGMRLAWRVADIAQGTLTSFPTFTPTDAFLLIVPYFDQYAQSVSFWAPDGRYLVFADLDEHQQPSIRVLDTAQPGKPARRLAGGTFATWSWH